MASVDKSGILTTTGIQQFYTYIQNTEASDSFCSSK